MSFVPASVPSENAAVARASPHMELSENIVTDASSFCTGQPVWGSSMW